MRALSNLQRDVLLAGLGGLRKFCFSLTGNAADADDLLQTTVEKVLDKGMPQDAHAAKWAYRICKNAWIDELRSREVRGRYPQLVTEQVVEQPTEFPSAEQTASGEQEIAAVSDALDRIPADQRLALTLVAMEGKTYAEAAEILEVPVGTIMSRIARARSKLMETYDPSNENK